MFLWPVNVLLEDTITLRDIATQSRGALKSAPMVPFLRMVKSIIMFFCFSRVEPETDDTIHEQYGARYYVFLLCEGSAVEHQ
jgi:hypothetical protein